MNFRTLLSYITPPRGSLLLSAALMLAGSLIALLNPLLAGQLTRTVLAEPDASVYPLHWIVLAWGVLMITRTTLSLISNYHLGMVAEHMATSLRNRVYDHMQALPLSWHQARRRGQVLSLITNDADSLSGFVTDTLLPLLPLLLTLLGAFLMMLRLDWVIALLVITGLPAYYLALKLIGREIRPLSRAWTEQYASLVARAEENLALLPAVKAFGREPLESERFQGENRKLLGIWRKQLRLQSVLSPTIDLLAGLGMLALLWLGSRHIAEGSLAPEDMVSLVMYAGLLIRPLSNLADVYGHVQSARGYAERLVDFFSQQQEPHGGGTPLPRVTGEIRFESVDFGYPDGPPLLQGLELHIRAGETVAITGANGAGKTTLAHLLLRFIAPGAGKISIDGHDIADATLESLRQQVGLVAQHVLLLNGTVAENIAYARPAASMAEIEAAARAAHAEAFIAELPQGYQTVIGDEGIKLSGGQRQRLSLARTLLKDPPILILDEATAMFDPAGEASFIAECHEMLRQRTVILITHRPASLALADRVLAMKKGEGVELLE